MRHSQFLQSSEAYFRQAFKRVMYPTTDKKDDDSVWLFHGDSEANLKTILEDGFQPRYHSAHDKLRSIISTMTAPENVEAKVSEAISKDGLSWRLYEIGNTLYTTSDNRLAANYALKDSSGGGEIRSYIHDNLFPYTPALSLSSDARPVILQLKTLQGEVVYTRGGSYSKREDGRTTIDGTYEVLLKTMGGIKVTGVTFARKINGAWSFEGQPVLSPKDALKQIQPQFTQPITAPAIDEAKRSILKEINDFQLGNDVNIVQDHATYAAQTLLPGTGSVRVPDVTFKPLMEARFGWAGLSSKYNLPYNLTPIEVNAYMTVLDVKAARGEMTPDEKTAKMNDLYTEMERINPQLKDVTVNRHDPAKLHDAIEGVLNYIKPQDIQHQLHHRAQDGMTFIGNLSWHLSPETSQSMDRKIEESRLRLQAELDKQAKPDAPAAPAKNKGSTNRGLH